MTEREKTIADNDDLRIRFKGGEVLMTPTVWDLGAEERGRALYRMTLYDKFDDESLHDQGIFIFGGRTFIWYIADFAGKRCLTLSLKEDF